MGQGTQNILDEECDHLFIQPQAAAYFNEAQTYALLVHVCSNYGIGSRIPPVLQDDCAAMNLVTEAFPEKKG